MKINLRKANALQNVIREALQELDLSTTVSINEFEQAATRIEQVRDQFNTNFKTRSDLVSALYEIRTSVAKANSQAGISDALATLAEIDKNIAFLTKLAKSAEQAELAVINGKLGKIASADGKDAFYMREDTVSTSIFTKQDLDSFKQSLAVVKKNKQNLQDQLLELNVTTKILIADSTVKVLEDQGLV